MSSLSFTLTITPPVHHPCLSPYVPHLLQVKVWELGSRKCVTTFDKHKDQVWGVAYSPDGSHLVSAGDDAMVQVYKVA